MAQDQLRVIDIVGRYGGDEFLLLLIQTGPDGARECTERIPEQIARSDCFGKETHRQVTVSIGVTQHRQRESLQDTLQRADAALYRAKTSGRNQVECG